jgi:hypothetical protein
MVIDMPNRRCQYHGGEKDEQGFLVFCGKPVAPEYSYCPDHVRRIYQRSNVSYGPKVPAEAPAEIAVEAPAEAVEVATAELEREAA